MLPDSGKHFAGVGLPILVKKNEELIRGKMLCPSSKLRSIKTTGLVIIDRTPTRSSSEVAEIPCFFKRRACLQSFRPQMKVLRKSPFDRMTKNHDEPGRRNISRGSDRSTFIWEVFRGGFKSQLIWPTICKKFNVIRFFMTHGARLCRAPGAAKHRWTTRIGKESGFFQGRRKNLRMSPDGFEQGGRACLGCAKD